MTIVVGTPIAPWKCDGRQEMAWLDNAEEMTEKNDIEFFAALEIDGRGLSPFRPLFDRMREVEKTGTDVDYWRFAFDDGSDKVETNNRLIRICLARNMVHEFAMRNKDVSHILFMDSDITPPPDAIPKLLELDRPVAGGRVPIYALGDELPSLAEGPHSATGDGVHHDPVGGYVPPGADVRAHWNTAGFLLIRRDVFSTVAWHYDLDNGCSDDPAFQNAVRKAGYGETWVRHDLKAKHVPIPMVAVEHRPGDKKHVAW